YSQRKTARLGMVIHGKRRLLYVASKYAISSPTLVRPVLNGRPYCHACMKIRNRGLLLSCSDKSWLFSEYRVWGSRDHSLGSFLSPKSTPALWQHHPLCSSQA